ncbi:MAG: hypothetical protein EOO05_18120 [Chitinophagaceae bacterium]|nr:MAG: hypothetical protein EOO05_18120 [Chitinophagaceae bacterium]
MKLTLFPIAALLLANLLQAQNQSGQLEMKINKDIFRPGDSLAVTIEYANAGTLVRNPALATVELVVENEAGQRTRLRWPMLNSQASGSLLLPDSLAPGKYTLSAGLQQRFFEVVGKVKNEEQIGAIQAMLLTKDGNWDQQKVTVLPDGSFVIRNWLFEDNALLAFQRLGNDDRPMDISINTQLDSSYQPLAVTGRIFYIGNPPAGAKPDFNQPVKVDAGFFADRGDLLPAVIVKSSRKTVAQQFDEEYVNGLFRSADERLISIMDQPSALGFPNVLSYLQGRVAGLQISPNGGARWRGGPVTFFLDEMRTSAQQIASVPMQDIAIVKAYPPPFLGSPGGGGGVAVYTRRGGEAGYLPSNRQVFRVRGYTPASTILNMDKLRL